MKEMVPVRLSHVCPQGSHASLLLSPDVCPVLLSYNSDL